MTHHRFYDDTLSFLKLKNRVIYMSSDAFHEQCLLKLITCEKSQENNLR